MPGLQCRPSEASVWPWGHTQVNLGECLLTCGAGRHMKEQPPFSAFSLHQLVPGLRKQQYLVTANISLDSSRSNQSSKIWRFLLLLHRLLSHRIRKTCCCYCSHKFRTHQTAELAHGTQWCLGVRWGCWPAELHQILWTCLRRRLPHSHHLSRTLDPGMG